MTSRRFLARPFAVCLGCLCLEVAFTTLHADTKRFDIQIGEPSIWSLEQAHYLLAKMRALDQGLQNAPPSATDLDPNQIQATRMELLQSLLNAEVSFDRTAGVKNQLALQAFHSDFDRKQGLREDVERLRGQDLAVTEQLTILNTQLQKLGTGDTDKQQKAVLNAEISGKQAEKAALESQMTAEQSELSSLSLSTPSLSTPTLTSNPQLPSSALSKLMQGTQAGVGAPKLHASTVLDNYIQMQYEIIAKQLTLLREEVGPYNRLVFLELPYSIYSTPSNANDSLVQVDWKILGYYPITSALANITNQRSLASNLQQYTTSLTFQGFDKTQASQENKAQNPCQPQTAVTPETQRCRTQEVPYSQEDVKVLDREHSESLESMSARTDMPPIRVVDMIPRQSALNVNQTYDNVKGLALSLRFMELFGLGGRVDYQRQRENYEQFVHQDAFATAKGKGLTEFGWTFGPLPGSKQIAPGVRTTYAVLIVPKNAAAIKLEASGYAFPRKELPVQPSGKSNRNALTTKTFLVTIPPTQEGFYLTAADYTPATPGNYTTLYLRGSYFSPQIGVLVNGIPLQRVVGIAQQDLNLSAAGSNGVAGSTIRGQFEQVNQQILALAFTMGPNFQGIPTISLVTPEKAVDIMYYKICINRFNMHCPVNEQETLLAHAQLEPMFTVPLTVTGLKLLKVDPASGQIRALLSGTGFRDQSQVTTSLLLNGRPLDPARMAFLSATSYQLALDPTDDPTLDIMMTQVKGGSRTESAPLAIPNPFRPQVAQTEIISDVPKTPTSPGVMQVHIQGIGLNLISSVRAVSGARQVTLIPVSATDLVLSIQSPSEPTTIVLEGPVASTGTSKNGSFITIKRPQAPHIASITNPSTKNATGTKAGGYPVTIQGAHLQSVTDVLFGANPGQILQSSDNTLTVQVPSGNVGTVQVTLKLGIVYLGTKLDNSADLKSPNATFTYTDK